MILTYSYKKGDGCEKQKSLVAKNKMIATLIEEDKELYE